MLIQLLGEDVLSRSEFGDIDGGDVGLDDGLGVEGDLGVLFGEV